MLFAAEWKMTPFEVLQTDIDDFIIIVNYLLANANENKSAKSTAAGKKETRIRVNDKTATGGWF